jgi:DNA-binding transcriptional LysR family regulator
MCALCASKALCDAQSARALAALISDGAVGVLKIAVSNSIELGLILAQVSELRRHFSEIELKILRGSGPRLVEFLKSGEAELAVSASIGAAWDRLDCWKLFDEPFDMIFNRMHRLANQETIDRPARAPCGGLPPQKSGSHPLASRLSPEHCSEDNFLNASPDPEMSEASFASKPPSPVDLRANPRFPRLACSLLSRP